jgi:hypothetical protein
MCSAAAIRDTDRDGDPVPVEPRLCLECRQLIEKGQGFFRFRAGYIHADCFVEPPAEPD